MKNNTAARDRSGSGDSPILEETSSELKFDSSQRWKSKKGVPRSLSGRVPRSPSGRHPRKMGSAAEASDTLDDRDRTKKNSNKTGNTNEDDTSPLTNVGEGNGNRSSDNPIEEFSPVDRREEMIRDVRQKCGVWVNDDRVQITMVTFIFINAIMMGIATFDFIKRNEAWNVTFVKCDRVFLVIFTIELVMQGVYHGINLLSDGWLTFDLIIISASWGLQSLQIVRAFRVFRAFRLVTRVKIMKDLILALFSVMPRMAAIFLMLLLIFYIFAVMFTQLFEESVNDDVKAHFGNLPSSLLTLFQIMTMDEWAEVWRLEYDKHVVVARTFMIAFVVVSGFIVVNLIVAVICDAIGALDEKDKAKFHGQHNDDDDDSDEKLELREQLDTIEDQIGDLTRIQARTFHTLEYLTQQLRIQKEKTTSDATSTGSKSISTSADDTPSEEPKKDRRASMLKKTSGERSRRKSFATMGYSSKRNTYTDTWTQEGSEKSLRKAMITNFAKSARQLQKMREEEAKAEEEGNKVKLLGMD